MHLFQWLKEKNRSDIEISEGSDRAFRMVAGYKAIFFIWAIVGLLFILSCSVSDTETNNTDAGELKSTASIELEFRLVRPFEENSSNYALSENSPDICEDYRISKIEIAVYRSDTREYVLSELKIWDCDAHTSGPLSVPAGVSLYMDLTGYVDNSPCWITTVPDIWVEPDATEHVLIDELTYHCSDVDPPLVINRYPAPNAQDVGLGESISATFNERLAPSTVYDHAITLSDGSNSITGDIRYVKETSTIFFNPHISLSPATIYEVTLDNAEGDITDTATNPFGQTLTWQFTTSNGFTSPPRVVGTQPIDDAFGVPYDTPIQATFSKPIDFSSVPATQITVNSATGPVSGSITYNADTRTISFQPDTGMELNTLFTATISEHVTDLDGVSMGIPYQWQFTTEGVRAPQNLSIDGTTLMWAPNSPVPDGYRLYMRTEGEAYDYGSPVWEGAQRQATIENLPNGMTYYFVVRAFISNDESNDSNEVSVTLF